MGYDLWNMHILYYTIVYYYVFLIVSVLCSNDLHYIIHNMNIDYYNEIYLPFYKVLD